MPITVAMIEEKDFKIKMRGYDPVEVDEFLDEICDEMVAMQDEISMLQSRLNQASQAASAYTPAAVPPPAPIVAAPVKEVVKEVVVQEDSSEAALKLLARAQKIYDDMVADAKAEAAKILSGASARVDNSTEELKEEKAALEKEVEMLKAAARDYRERFQRLVQDQQHVLNAETELFE